MFKRVLLKQTSNPKTIFNNLTKKKTISLWNHNKEKTKYNLCLINHQCFFFFFLKIINYQCCGLTNWSLITNTIKKHNESWLTWDAIIYNPNKTFMWTKIFVGKSLSFLMYINSLLKHFLVFVISQLHRYIQNCFQIYLRVLY